MIYGLQEKWIFLLCLRYICGRPRLGLCCGFTLKRLKISIFTAPYWAQLPLWVTDYMPWVNPGRQIQKHDIIQIRKEFQYHSEAPEISETFNNLFMALICLCPKFHNLKGYKTLWNIWEIHSVLPFNFRQRCWCWFFFSCARSFFPNKGEQPVISPSLL